MAIIPIFIPVYRKTDKELQEEMERDRRWNALMEKEREEQERRKREAELEKKLKIEEERKKLNDWYEDLRRKDEWDTQFLPEGWTIFGQARFSVITEYSEHDFPKEDELSISKYDDENVETITEIRVK